MICTYVLLGLTWGYAETLHHIVIYSCWDDHEIEHLQACPLSRCRMC